MKTVQVKFNEKYNLRKLKIKYNNMFKKKIDINK